MKLTLEELQRCSIVTGFAVFVLSLCSGIYWSIEIDNWRCWRNGCISKLPNDRYCASHLTDLICRDILQTGMKAFAIPASALTASLIILLIAVLLIYGSRTRRVNYIYPYMCMSFVIMVVAVPLGILTIMFKVWYTNIAVSVMSSLGIAATFGFSSVITYDFCKLLKSNSSEQPLVVRYRRH